MKPFLYLKACTFGVLPAVFAFFVPIIVIYDFLSFFGVTRSIGRVSTLDYCDSAIPTAGVWDKSVIRRIVSF